MELVNHIKKKSWIIIFVTILSFFIGQYIDNSNFVDSSLKKVSHININYNIEDITILSKLEYTFNLTSDERVTKIHEDVVAAHGNKYFLSIFLDRYFLIAGNSKKNVPKFLSSSDYDKDGNAQITFSFLHDNDDDDIKIEKYVRDIIDNHYRNAFLNYRDSLFETLISRYNMLFRKISLQAKINNEMIGQKLIRELKELKEKEEYLLKSSEIFGIDSDKIKDQFINQPLSEDNFFVFELLYPDLYIEKYRREIEKLTLLLNEKNLIASEEKGLHLFYEKNIKFLEGLSDDSAATELGNLALYKNLSKLIKNNPESLNFLEEAIKIKESDNVSINEFSKINVSIIISLISFIITILFIVSHFYYRRIIGRDLP